MKDQALKVEEMLKTKFCLEDKNIDKLYNMEKDEVMRKLKEIGKFKVF